MRKKKNIPKENLKDPVDRYIHYFGQPTIQVRHNLPLPVPVDKWTLSTTSSSSTDMPKTAFREFDVPNYNYNPQIYHQLLYERKHGVNIPGQYIVNKYLMLIYCICNSNILQVFGQMINKNLVYYLFTLMNI